MEAKGTETNLSAFAESINMPLERLCSELREIGVKETSPDSLLTHEDKMRLLLHLRNRRGNEDPNSEPARLTLRRRTLMELKGVTNVQGAHRQRARVRSIPVEFRKSRTYYKRGHMAHHEEERQQQEREQEQALAAAEEVTSTETVDTTQSVAEGVQAPVQEGTTPVAATEPTEEASEKGAVPATGSEAGENAVEPVTETGKTAAEEQPPAPDVPVADAMESAPKKKKSKETEKRDSNMQELHVAKDKSGRRRKKKTRTTPVPVETQHSFQKPVAPMVREVNVPETITVADLAQNMAVKSQELIKLLMNLGTMVTINQSIDQDTAVAVVEEMGHKARRIKEDHLEEELMKSIPADSDEQPRAPVITVMGHVDHGKTTLIDRIRSSRVTEREAGGITQHIGAYMVSLPTGGELTVIDTPGHEAFSGMRARGAKITDIIIIVVAADDGVMPQTKEAIQHAIAASIPMIVAVNKMDREDADLDKVRQALANEQVIPEEWGGEVVFVPLSAKTGEGIDKLLEAISVQADVLELRAPKTGPAKGTVLEARSDRNRGPVATVLVQSGLLHAGDFLLAGHEFGRVRSIMDEDGKEIDEAEPSRPVVVLGLSGPPESGDAVMVVADERKARELADQRRSKSREKDLAARAQASTQEAMARMGSGEQGEESELRVVLKADTQGVVEALLKTLPACSTDKVKVNVIASGIGGITVSDVNLLTVAGNGVLVGFNVRADSQARRLLREEGQEARYYSVIYDLINDIKTIAAEQEKPETRDEIVGLAEVKEVFRAARVGEVAGCIVTEGTIKKGYPIRVLRDNVVIYEGELESLRRFKNDVQDVKSGMECGIGVKNYKNIEAGDQIEVFAKKGGQSN